MKRCRRVGDYADAKKSDIALELEYSPDPAKIVDWVEEAYRETAKLMDLADLRKQSR